MPDDSTKPRRKVTAEEVARRCEQLETMLASCVGTRTVERVLAAEWGIGRRMVRRYIERIKLGWLATANATAIEARRVEIDAITKNAMAALAAEGNYVGVMRGAELLARLHGVEAPKRLEHTGAGGGPPKLEVRITLDQATALAKGDEP